MASNLPNTRSGRAADAILRSMLADYDPDGEMSTGERQYRIRRTAQLRAAIALIPDAEVDSAALVLLGCTPEQARDRLAFAAEGLEVSMAGAA